MREWIVSGLLTPGDRLPSEAELAARFGTSRTTIREALRMLSSESLIATRPGAKGGSTVERPDPGRITEIVHATLGSLVGTSDLSLDELLEARELIEIPAASLAAANREDHHLATLHSLLPQQPEMLAATELLDFDRAFHDTVLLASGNRLLPIITAPVYRIILHRFERSRQSRAFWRRVVDQHRDIFEAVQARDPSAAAQQMKEHLEHLRPAYAAMEVSPDDPVPRV